MRSRRLLLAVECVGRVATLELALFANIMLSNVFGLSTGAAWSIGMMMLPLLCSSGVPNTAQTTNEALLIGLRNGVALYALLVFPCAIISLGWPAQFGLVMTGATTGLVVIHIAVALVALALSSSQASTSDTEQTA